ERAKDLRKELKNELGYTAKQVSVKMAAGIAIEVTIKDYTVNCEEVEKIAKKYDSVDWDEHTGEILEGGNIFVEINNIEIKKSYFKDLYSIEQFAKHLTLLK